jgi:hypothetical protein
MNSLSKLAFENLAIAESAGTNVKPGNVEALSGYKSQSEVAAPRASLLCAFLHEESMLDGPRRRVQQRSVSHGDPVSFLSQPTAQPMPCCPHAIRIRIHDIVE